MSYKFLELVAEVGADTSKFTASMGGIKGQVESVKATAMKALGVAGLAGAVAKAGEFAANSIGDWSKYAEEMKKGADVARLSVEDYSRLTQAADDLRVSQEALEKAVKMAAQNGFEPSIESLAQLADKVKKTNTATEQAALLQPIFGKGWSDMLPALIQGGDAIRSATAAVDEGLVVTKKAAEENKRYYENVDRLNDSYTALKNNLGRAVIPVLSSAMAHLSGSEEAIKAERQAMIDNYLSWDANKQARYEHRDSILAWIDAAAKEAAAIGTQTGRLATLQKAGSLLVNQQAIEQQAWDDVTTSMKEYNDQLLFQIASKGLSGDAALDLAKKMGLVDEATMSAMDAVSILKSQYDEAKMSAGEYATKISDIQAAIASLESRHVEITIDAILNEIRNAVAGANEAGRRTGTDRYGGERTFDGERALGGPVYPGHTYLVGELGAEHFIPQVAGFISPSGKATQPAPVVNVYVSGTGNPDYVAQKAADLVMQKFKR